MKKFFCSAAVLLIAVASFSQTTISGRILSADDHQPLLNATIAISRSKSGELLTGTISDEQGRFSIANLTSGECDISISFIGYETAMRRVLAGALNKALDLGKILLNTSSVEIGAVDVRAQKQAVSAGLETKSYSAESIISVSTGSVLDMMKSLPGVTIDQESRVILRGSDKMAIRQEIESEGFNVEYQNYFKHRYFLLM
jgi:hypothetical protein